MSTQKKSVSVAMLLVIILCMSAISAFALDASSAVQYLKANQAQDGGFAEPGEGSNIKTTCWAVLGILAAGEDPKALVKNGVNPVDYMAAHAREISKIEDYELFLLAYSEAGGDPHNVAGLDMVSIVASFEGKDGKIGDDMSQHCMGVISLVSAGEEASSKWGEWIVQNQRSDGGWGESKSIRETALAVETLVALGEGSKEIIEPAMKFLMNSINGDGGYSGNNEGSESQTTSLVIRAINAVGDDPGSNAWSFQGNSPMSFMNSAQKEDGHFSFSVDVNSEPTLTTGMAIPPIAGKHLPFDSINAEAQFQKVDDLGTLGAGMVKTGSGASDWIDKTTEMEKGSEISEDSSLGRVSAGYTGEKKTQSSSLWLLLIVAISYLLILLVAGVVTRIIFQS